MKPFSRKLFPDWIGRFFVVTSQIIAQQNSPDFADPMSEGWEDILRDGSQMTLGED
jgi:hypothetical protein